MDNRVNFKFTKDWGTIKKGTVKKLDRAFCRSLQDVRKVGVIVTAPKKEKKAVIPPEDKVDKTVQSRATK